MASAAPAPAVLAPPPSQADELAKVDAALEALSARKAAWAAAPVAERIAVLKEIRARLLDQVMPWSRATATVRTCAPPRDADVAGEVVATGTIMTGQLDGLIASLTAFQRTGAFPSPPATTTAAGQTVVHAFPWGFRDRRLSLLGAAGGSVDVYLRPGKEASQGAFYRQPHGGKVAVLLGAGNQHFLALSDALHMAFVEGCTVLLKYHPLQAPVAPFIDYVLEPLARRGYYASSVNPELAITQRMLYSPLTDCVHMTGGTATHDAIVWGADPEEQARRRVANDPLLKVPITSELGCVTPWLVVPGPWSEAELTHHARALTEGIASNCSCNCLAPKVVMLAEGWPQADAFIAAVKAELALRPAPSPYYPGVRQRHAAFQKAYPQAEAIVAPAAEPEATCGEPLPYLVNVLPSWPADPASENAFRVEPFAPVVTFVKVPTGSSGGADLAEAYLQRAVKEANEHMWGSLSCTVLVHPETEAAHPQAVQTALEELRYGAIAVNAWSALAFTPAQGHWGAWGGDQTIADVGSGIGAVHNTYMFDHSQKAVVRTPFVSSLHLLPQRYSPLPLPVAKIVAGLVHGGPLGALKMWWRS